MESPVEEQQAPAGFQFSNQARHGSCFFGGCRPADSAPWSHSGPSPPVLAHNTGILSRFTFSPGLTIFFAKGGKLRTRVSNLTAQLIPAAAVPSFGDSTGKPQQMQGGGATSGRGGSGHPRGDMAEHDYVGGRFQEEVFRAGRNCGTGFAGRDDGFHFRADGTHLGFDPG